MEDTQLAKIRWKKLKFIEDTIFFFYFLLAFCFENRTASDSLFFFINLLLDKGKKDDARGKKMKYEAGETFISSSV